MQDRFFNRITEGMDVYDFDGDKVGTVGKIYQPVRTGGTTVSTPSMSETESSFKVDTGFLGLGKDLYIPTSAISDVTTDRVTLNVDKDRLDSMGWDRRPSWVEDY